MAELAEVITAATELATEAKRIIDGVETTYNELSDGFKKVKNLFQKIFGTAVYRYSPYPVWLPLCCTPFIPVSEFTIYMTHIQNIDFSSKSERRMCVGVLNEISKTTYHLREFFPFPLNNVFVAPYLPPIKEPFVQLIYSLSMPTTKNLDEFRKYHDIFSKSLSLIFDLIPKSSFDKQSFEITFGLRYEVIEL